MKKDIFSELLALGTGAPLDYDRNDTFIDAFLRQVEKTPDATAVVDEYGSITYGELNRRSDHIAAELLKIGVKIGDFVAIRLPWMKEFLVAVIGIWKAGGAYMPVDSDYPEERIRYMLEDSGAKVVIDLDWLQKLQNPSQPKIVQNLAHPDGVAILMYTSGSTGRPKGVLNTHRGIRALCHNVISKYYEDGDKIAQILSFSYIVSCFDLFPPLINGHIVYILNRSFLTDISALDRYIREKGITILTIIPQIGMPLIEEFHTPLRAIGMGGARMDKSMQFDKQPDLRIFSAYGLTETCAAVLFWEFFKNTTGDVHALGHPAPGVTVLLEDEDGNPVPRGEIGEVCIASPQVAAGYWHNDELTAQVFVDRPWSEYKVFRSGDLARWNDEGILEFHGRRDDMVKIRGNRVELGEVESVLLKVNGIRTGAVAMKEVGGESTLCAYYVSSEPVSGEYLRDSISEFLPPYMIPSFLIRMDVLPKLPNGKIDRKALPAPEMKETESVLPETVKEQEVYDIVADTLRIDRFGVTTNLIFAGMTSIEAMRLAMRLQQMSGTSVMMTDLLSHPTVRDLTALMENASETESRYGTVHPIQEYYPLTENQKGVYIDWERHKDGLQYNVPYALQLKNINQEKLAEAIRKVVNAHPILKMRFADVEGVIMQRRDDLCEAEVTMSALPAEAQRDGESLKRFFQSQVRAFDLFNDTLYRFEIYTFNEVTYLFKDTHHIVTDGLSEGRLIKEMLDAYEGKEIEKEVYTFYDYALESAENESDESYIDHETYFKELIGETEATVYPRSNDATGEGRSRTVSIDIAKSSIETERSKQGVTASSYILHSLMQVIKSISREDRVLITAVSNGRGYSCMQPCQGFFVKTLPVLSEDSAAELQSQFIRSISHEEYPLTRIVESTGIHPGILYAYEGELYGESLRNRDIEPIPLSLDTPKMPISIIVNPDVDDKYIITAEYDDSLYTERDMLTLLHCVRTMSTEGRLVTEEEERELIALGTGERLDYDRTKTFVDLFTEQAAKTPDNTAVVDKESRITYRELDEESDRIAHWLIEEHHIEPDDFVAVMLPRRKEFVTSVLGIWKAGAAYVPIDPEYPEERRRFMTEDCEAKAVINGDIWNDIALADAQHSHINRAKPEGLAYMIYTSGSTGKPKGVMIGHKGLTNYALANVMICGLSAADKIAAHFSFSFSAHIIDIYPVLAAGASICIVPEEDRKDTERLYHFLEKHRISGCYLTSSLASLLYDQYILHLRYLGVTGEKVQGMVSGKSGVQVINGYGSSEGTDLTSTYTLLYGVDYQSNVPIGRPMPNCYVLIVDNSFQLVPRGEVGELCFAGCLVGKGYWHNPDLTTEKFIDCPYLPDEKMYRTGDLVRWNGDGQLEYIGRTDNQIKFRGYRIELGEIESAAMKTDGISHAVATVKNGTLCLYYTGTATEGSIKSELSKILPKYMLPGIFIHLEAIPLTPNGKTDRKALPEPEMKEDEMIAPETELEKQYFAIVCELLKTNQFGVTTNLISAGLTSITAMKLSGKLKQMSGIMLSTRQILTTPTIRELIWTTARRGTTDTEVKTFPKQEFYPLSESAQAFYSGWERKPKAIQYNMPCVMMMEGIDVERFRNAIIATIHAHPFLKMRITDVNGDVMMQRRDDAEVTVRVTQVGNEPAIDFFETLVKPFDLKNDDLYRLSIYEHDGKVFLFSDFHHIVIDGTSIHLFLDDVARAYDGDELKPETFTTYDRALEEQHMADKALKEEDAYFKTLMRNKTVTVYPYSTTTDCEADGDTMRHAYADVDGGAIRDYCHEHGLTESNYFLTVTMLAMQRLTRQDNIVLIAYTNGRSATRMQQSVGLFLKSLPVTMGAEDIKPTLAETVKGIQAQTQHTYSLDYYPFSRLKNKYALRSEIAFLYQGGIFDVEHTLGGKKINFYPLSLRKAQDPLIIEPYPNGKGGYMILIEYDGSLFGKEDMFRLANCLKTMAEEAVKHEDDLKAIPSMCV